MLEQLLGVPGGHMDLGSRAEEAAFRVPPPCSPLLARLLNVSKVVSGTSPAACSTLRAKQSLLVSVVVGGRQPLPRPPPHK